MDYEKNSKIFKALAHPLRLKMVEMLLDDECCVTDVSNALGMPQSTSSQHISILKNAGVVFPKKYGTRTCYFVNEGIVTDILKILKKES